jgi:hypothetical protein
MRRELEEIEALASDALALLHEGKDYEALIEFREVVSRLEDL